MGVDLPIQEQAAVAATFLDHPEFCKRTITIRDKRGIDVPLIHTPAQTKLNNAIAKQAGKGVPIRIRVLKAGQVHMSVGCCSQIWRRVAFLPGQQAKVYAHLHEATRNLYGYIDQFERSYKPLAGLEKLKTTTGSRVNQTIVYEGGGRIEFGSAETSSGGRSTPFKVLHLSETAFWQRADALRTGLLNRVPDLADTLIIDESTANGTGGPFHQGWQEAVKDDGSNGWVAVFFAWHEHPEYVLAPKDPVAFEKSLTQEEHSLRGRYNLTLAQLHWRRYAIKVKCEGDLRKFQQEFPACAEEAFLVSGRPVFDMAALVRHPVVQQPFCGDLEQVRVGTKTHIEFIPREDNHGLLRVWRRPEPGHLYVIGTDVAKGIDVRLGAGTADTDFSVAQVIDQHSGEQVAVFRGRIVPEQFAQYTWDLMQWYNFAYCVPDADGLALAFLQELLRLQVPLEFLYSRKRDVDDQTSTPLHHIGHLTTRTTKPQIIGLLGMALREMAIYVRDPATMAELQRFVFATDGKMAAEQGAHDDCVMALALAVLGTQQPYVWTRQPLAKPGAKEIHSTTRYR